MDKLERYQTVENWDALRNKLQRAEDENGFLQDEIEDLRDVLADTQAELAEAKEEASREHTTAMWLSADLATLQDALNDIICITDEAEAISMGDAGVSLKDMMKIGRISYKALKATTPKHPEAEPVTNEQ